MYRDDLSDSLIHLTKGEYAIQNFFSIMRERVLLGGDGFIRDKFRCVCFSEAPITKFPQLLAEKHDSFRYKPYGLMVKKRWLYQRGGRPVIYQDHESYDLLPLSMRHLHVRFRLGGAYDVDYTWEREWRIRADRLEFGPEDVTLVVPTREVSEHLHTMWAEWQDSQAKEGEIEQVEPYPWHQIVLSDLGIEVPDLLEEQKSLREMTSD